MKLLCVIDMQKDFIDGALGTPEAQKILPAVKEKIAAYRQKGDTVVFTRDTHEENYMETLEGKNLPVPHCIRGTAGWEIAPALYFNSAAVIDKPTFGSFALADFAADLENLEEIEVVGLCTDICVISNALILKARLREIPVSVDSSCCAGVTPQSHLNALEAMKMCQISVK